MINRVEKNVYSLELWHGPTCAFKDVGARFLARCLSSFVKGQGKVTILVATSGDTGSAVANGFYEVEGIDVIILYPKGKVSNEIITQYHKSIIGDKILKFKKKKIVIKIDVEGYENKVLLVN